MNAKLTLNHIEIIALRLSSHIILIILQSPIKWHLQPY